MANWLSGTIDEKKQWNDRLFSLRIRADFPVFKPGQFVRVALDVDGERIARPYSLVNTPDDSCLEIFFNIVPEGPLSPRLARLESGDGIFVSNAANGFLVVDEIPPCRHLWMLATGTGLGPFLSILKSTAPWPRFEKLVLAYSVRERSELAYAELIAQLQQQHAGQFEFVPFITREKVAGSLNQRITAALEDGSLEDRVGLRVSAGESHVMMCGNSAMISAVSEVLQQRGLRKHLRREPGHLTTEKYH
ncbi:MAG TPA: ferredoxin--NADP reductase [Thiotrichales bacterium]|nr:ferredoxin--NADP reductase [Thiotrichales bacterium]